MPERFHVFRMARRVACKTEFQRRCQALVVIDVNRQAARMSFLWVFAKACRYSIWSARIWRLARISFSLFTGRYGT